MYKGIRDVQFLYNDYELLYLASMNDEEAINLILKKYEKMIYKFNQKFDVNPNCYDDYFQEARLVILKAINTFDISSKKSFTKYLELLMYHRYIDLTRKKNKIIYDLVNDDTIDYYNFESEKSYELKEEVVINYDEFSKFENDIFKYKYEKKMKPREIAEALNVPVNKVYSAIERIKGKIKSHNDNNKGDLLDKKRDF